MNPLIVSQLRPALMALLSALVAFGVLPQELYNAAAENVGAVLGGFGALWTIVAAVRNWREARRAARLHPLGVDPAQGDLWL